MGNSSKENQRLDAEIGNIARQWSKIEEIGEGAVNKYLKAVAQMEIAIVDYSEFVEKLLEDICIDGSIIVHIYINPEQETPPLSQRNIIVYDDLTQMLKAVKGKIIIDSDFEKYNIRQYRYEAFDCFSYTILNFFKRINDTEMFRWYATNVEHKREMMTDFFKIMCDRYSYIAVCGESDFADDFIEGMKDRISGGIIKINRADVRIKDVGKVVEIVNCSATRIDGVFYAGMYQDAMFAYGNRRVDVINVNAICKEMYMSYDLSYNVIPKLVENGVDVKVFLYPEYYTLNLQLKARGKDFFKRKPMYHNMINDPRFKEDIKKFFGELYTEEYADKIRQRPTAIDIDGVRRYADFHNAYYNTFDGHRMTTDCPENPSNTIHMFGKCVAMGRYVEDKNTISSYLQREINKKFDAYEVLNYGIEADTEIHKKLRKLQYKNGDVVIIVYRYYDVYHRLKNTVDYLNNVIIEMTQSHREYFLDSPEHFNHIVNNAVSDEIYKVIESDLSDDVRNKDGKYFSLEGGVKEDVSQYTMYPGLKQYVAELCQLRASTIDSSTVGAVVMNCNPFTLGHKHLIDYARKQCDFLYVFVVEENKSIFSFEDRFELVRAGVAEFDNVVVMPSGKFMISASTFPEYFTKDAPTELTIDPSNDVKIFANHIAPALGISIRFAGEEPLDIITKQYNDTMRRILPQSGIEFNIIPRIEFGEQVISASRVRECLRIKDFISIREIVPETTFKYLVQRFG